MKKHLSRILLILLLFIIFTNTAKADRGDLRYQVTDLTINGSEITIKGWAFLHLTNNYVTVYKNGYNTGEIVKSGGGQTIRITPKTINNETIKNKNGNNVIFEAEGSNDPNNPNYNFYFEHFYKGPLSKNINTYNDRSRNDCDYNEKQTGESQCYYQDIAFSATFDIDEWNIAEDTEVKFLISVKNNDYENGTYVPDEELFINESNKKIINNDKIEITKESYSKQFLFIAVDAYVRSSSDYSKRFDNPEGIGCYYGTYDDRKYIGKRINNSVSTYIGNNFFPLGSKVKGPGIYQIYTEKEVRDGCLHPCIPTNRNNTNCAVVAVFGSWIKPTGETSFKIKVKNDKKCEVSEPNSTGNTGGSNNSSNNGNSLIFSCNQNNNSGNNNGNNSENSSGKNIKKKFDSTCNELTVKANDSIRANVKITQTGSISGLLSPSSVYQGGGFNFGLLYSNTVSWSINSCSKSGIDCNEEDKEKIGQEMANKIKTLGDFTGNLNLGQIKFGKEDIDANFMYKSCTDNDDDNLTNFKKGQSLITTCLFHLPDSVIESYTGKVTYNIGDIGSGINNKYYTPMNYFGNYNITIDTISGMSRITDKSAITDSADKSKPWTGNWNGQLTDCSLNVRGRFYSNPGESSSANKKTTYAFIYRPIDIKNPFPNRNAGINWFEWYKKNSNKNKLEESYKYLQYTVNLDNKNLSTVKSYNKDKNYLSWDNIENNTSEFIDEYDFIKRKETNIPKEGNK